MSTNEAMHYLHRIADLRAQIRRIIDQLPVVALNWRPSGDSDADAVAHELNSIAVLVMHIAGAEHFWIGEVVGGLPATRDRAAEFKSAITDKTALYTRLDEIGAQTEQILSSQTPAMLDESRRARDRDVPVRWGILHTIEHTALHLGHMQITAQLWQSGTPLHHPRWFDRLTGQE